MKVFPNDVLIPNEAKLNREPAKGQQKTKEKQNYACADRDVSTGIKVAIRNENRANSIWNDFTFVPESCKHCTLKCRVTRGGMEEPERAHSGLKLTRVSCKHTLNKLLNVTVVHLLTAYKQQIGNSKSSNWKPGYLIGCSPFPKIQEFFISGTVCIPDSLQRITIIYQSICSWKTN